MTQIKSAVHFCDTVNSESITMFENPAISYIEFTKKIYEKEIHHGIYFMLGKRKDSPKTEKKKADYLKDYFKKVEVN